MVSLDKERPPIPFFDGSRHQHTEIFSRSLVGITDLGTSNLKDQGTRLAGKGGPKHSPCTVIGHCAQIDGRYRKIERDFAQTATDIEFMNGCRIYPQPLPQLPEEPPRSSPLSRVPEHRNLGQGVYGRTP